MPMYWKAAIPRKWNILDSMQSQFAVRYPLFRKGSEKVFGNVTENLLTFFTVTSDLFCLDVGYCAGKKIFL